jgi:RNA-directed DNA polymerase
MTASRTLYDRVRGRQVLLAAWRTIRNNARRSGNRQSRLEAERFDENLPANIENIQRRLQRRNYNFAPAIGVAKSKGNGKKGKRAIVVAPVSDRVVQRAILDVLYKHCPSAPLMNVLETPTSVGGVPGRGIGHALALIEEAENGGAAFAIRSDIRNFFPSFPRAAVLSYLSEQVSDPEFVDLFARAVTVELANRADLGPDAELFPLGEDGVAQGSPLSVLAGNIVLREFDAQLNGRGVVCVRYIDDFLVLAHDGKSARKALEVGLAVLARLKLHAYAPADGSDKAWAGLVVSGFDFLGYRVVRGLNPPSQAAREKLLAKVAAEIAEGKKWIQRVVKADQPQTKRIQCYIQTLTELDSLLRGWAGAFKYSRSTQALAGIDSEIDVQLAAFERWFGALVQGKPTTSYRRAMGIRVLSDTEPTPLPLVLQADGEAKGARRFLA